MSRAGFVLVGLVLFACNSRSGGDTEENGFSYSKFSAVFPEAVNSYQLSDTGLLNNRDTTVIRSSEFAALIPDSVKREIFGKTAKVRYIAMARVKASGNTSFYVVKAIGNNKKAALLLPFTGERFAAAFPFLVPDKDNSTTQISSIDRSSAIIQSVTKKKSGGGVAEGRNVYQYLAESNHFALVLTNPLNNTADVINPIDTLPQKQKHTGDYVKDKRNFVSVRDGRNPKQLRVFIHIEKGDCSGEIKGELFMTSSTRGVYRESGDPCSLSLQFTSTSVVVKEEGGCGSRRGLDCSFNGTFKKKKETRTKTAKNKASSK